MMDHEELEDQIGESVRMGRIFDHEIHENHENGSEVPTDPTVSRFPFVYFVYFVVKNPTVRRSVD